MSLYTRIMYGGLILAVGLLVIVIIAGMSGPECSSCTPWHKFINNSTNVSKSNKSNESNVTGNIDWSNYISGYSKKSVGDNKTRITVTYDFPHQDFELEFVDSRVSNSDGNVVWMESLVRVIDSGAGGYHSMRVNVSDIVNVSVEDIGSVIIKTRHPLIS